MVLLYMLIALAFCNSVNCALVPVDFAESMLKVARYDEQTVEIDQLADWKLYNDLYNQHIVNHRVYAQKKGIPKIVHHIWLGSPLPARCKWFIKTWKTQHPHWKFILWDDRKIAALKLTNQKAYDVARNYAEKSDIARYEILYRFGGVYADTDFECLQPLDELHACCDFYIGAYPDVGSGLCFMLSGIIGAVAGHPVLQRCIEGIRTQVSNGLQDPQAIIERTGPLFITSCLKAAITSGDEIGRCVPFPPTYFYPWPAAVRHVNSTQFIRSLLGRESLTVHHWARSWT